MADRFTDGQLFNLISGARNTGESTYDIWKSLGHEGEAAEFMEYMKKGAAGLVFDDELSETSENIVKNKVVTQKFNEVLGKIDCITPQMFGAKGDGVTDDYSAIQTCINEAASQGKSVFFPTGVYLINTPLVIPGSSYIYGSQATIKKTSETTITNGGTEINAIMVINGRNYVIEYLTLTGNNKQSGIAFGENSSLGELRRLSITKCKYGLHDFKHVWMVKFKRIHCLNCDNAFYFFSNFDKTTLTFENCWAENCGQAYAFRATTYASLISCAADHCNEITKNPYGQGYGNEASSLGVYTFESCKGISIVGCGTEYCYGNGALYFNSSIATIISFANYYTKTKFVPNYNSFPNYGMGIIQTGTEGARLTIDGFQASPIDAITVQTDYPNKSVGTIGYNYLNSTYGNINSYAIIVNNILYDNFSVVGQGNKSDVCFLPQINQKTSFKDYIELGGKRIYQSKTLTGSNFNKIKIPFKAQGNINCQYLLTVKGHSNESNTTSLKPFEATISCSSLLTVYDNAKKISGTDNVTVSAENTYLVITLSDTYNSILLSLDLLSPAKDNLDYDNIVVG